jgi:hypothetical protein
LAGGGNLLKNNQLHTLKSVLFSRFPLSFPDFYKIFFPNFVKGFFVFFLFLFTTNVTAQLNLHVAGNNGAGLYIGQDFTVQALGAVGVGAAGTIRFENGGSPDFRLKGNFLNEGTYTQGSEKIRFNGSALQNADFGGAGNTNVFSIHTDNNQNVKVTRDVNITSDVLYDVGHVLSTSSAYITLKESATATNAKAAAHNVGPIAKKLDAVFFSTFVFPTGDSLSYNPLSLEPEGGVDAKSPTTTTFLVEYHFIPPSNPNALADGLVQISEEEYWDVTRLEGNKNAALGLIWDEDSEIIIPDSLVVAFWDETNWRAAGKNNLTGNDNNGSIKSNMIDNFWGTSNKVTFGTKSVIAVLPIVILNFDAKKVDENSVDINWLVGNPKDIESYIVEKSTDLSTWTIVHTGTNNNQNYNSTKDNAPYPGVSYYRLKMVDIDGEVTYSASKVVNFEGLEIINVFPNPSNGNFSVTIQSSVDIEINLIMYDALGKLVKNEVYGIKSGINNINEYLPYARGRYFISVTTNQGNYYDYNYILIQ